MIRRLIETVRARRHRAAEHSVIGRMVSGLAGYRSVAALIYPETDYVGDPDVCLRLDAIHEGIGDRLRAVVSPDPSWKPGSFASLPVISMDELTAMDIDCVLIPSSRFAEILFWFFNTSSARRIPVVAPELSGEPHRIFLRAAVLDVLRKTPQPEVLEIGSIEHPLGGHRTTQALAETLWGQGSLTTIDINPFTLRLAEHYCASTPTRLAYLAGDCRVVLRSSAKTPLDFVLLHFMSDNSDDSNPLMEAFDLLETRLEPGAPVVFQSVRTGEALPGSLQAHLRSKGFHASVTPIPGSANPARYFVVATKPD